MMMSRRRNNKMNIVTAYDKIAKAGAVLDLNDPEVIEALTLISENLVLTNSIVSNAVYKKAQYPITDFEVTVHGVQSDSERKAIRERIEEFIRGLKLREFLIEVGLDYATYGIAIPTIEVKGEKYYYCPKCRTIHTSEMAQKLFDMQATTSTSSADKLFNVEVKVDKKKHTVDLITNIKCPRCNTRLLLIDTSYAPHAIYFEQVESSGPDIFDMFTAPEDTEEVETGKGKRGRKKKKKDSKGKRKKASEIRLLFGKKRVSLTRWNVRQIEVITNRFSQEVYVAIKPEDIKEEIEQVLRYGPLFIKDIDIQLLIAAKTNKRRIIDPRFVSVIKQPVPSGIKSPYFPPLARAYKESIVLYELVKTLLDAIPLIVPITIISSVPDTPLDGGAMAGTTPEKAQSLEQKIREAGRSEYKAVFIDYPIQVSKIGGTQSYLGFMNLIDALSDAILNGMDLPKSLLTEGTWSGNFVAMRMLENSLVHYVGALNDFLKKFVKAIQIAGFFPDVDFDITLIPFRRIDMIAETELMANLFGADNIPKAPYYKLFFGKDMEEVLDQVQQEKAIMRKYSMFEQIRAKLEMMAVEAWFQEIQQRPEPEEMAEMILEKAKNDPTVIEMMVMAAARQFGPSYAYRVLSIIEERARQQTGSAQQEDKIKPGKSKKKK